jgi:hypothetical protein
MLNLALQKLTDQQKWGGKMIGEIFEAKVQRTLGKFSKQAKFKKD